jgi:hypothetical protein
MGMIHGRTVGGSVIPILVAADGTLAIGSIAPGAITIDSVTIEKMIGGLPQHWNGTATDVAATVTFTATSRSILFDNIGDTNDLYFSLDGGTKWKKMGPESSISIMCDRTTIQVKCAAGLTTGYEIIAVVAE